MTHSIKFPRAAIGAAILALGSLATTPSALAFHGGGFAGGFHGGGFHGGGFGGFRGFRGGYGHGFAGGGVYGGWGGWGYHDYAWDYGPYDDDAYQACTFRRVHVRTAYGWLWRTYEYC